MNLYTTAKEKCALLFSQKSTLRLLLLGLGGLAMLVAASVFPGEKETPSSVEEPTFDQERYAAQTEERLEALIGRLHGAGETMVMITLEEGENYVYVTDEKTEEAPSGYQTEHVIYNTGNGSAPLLKTTYMPVIRGVVVLCQGGADPAIAGKITEMVSALLDVGTNRISVAKIS